MTEHNLLKTPGGWECNCCLWKWTSKPLSECPGIPRYSWETKPTHLMTKTQLGKERLKLSPNQSVQGCVQSSDGKTWWELYDVAQAIPKQKKSAPAKSTRPLCPIGFDCLLVAAQVGRPCPNKEYCAGQARPWSLPYQFSQLPSGTRILEVVSNSYIEAEREEKLNAGFISAVALPYRVIVDDAGKPILSVAHPNYDQKEAGWYRATSLSTEYLKWQAARRGMNYQDFQETDWSYQIYDHWTQRQQDYYLKWENTVIEYPHCILPPTPP